MWRFPVGFNTSVKRVVLLPPSNDGYYTAWKIFGGIHPFYLITGVATLVWVNQTKSGHPITIEQLVICCLSVACASIVTIGFFGVILLGDVYARMTNELCEDFDQLVKSKGNTVHKIHT